MPLYMLIKVDFGHRENVGLFDTQAKALAVQTSLELEMFDSGSLAGISFYIEEHFVK
jgi:hypothetical protein